MNARLILIALPGLLLSLAAGSALALATDSTLLAQTAQGLPYVALVAAALLAWRLHSTRLFAANLLLAAVYIGLHPAVFLHEPLAHALLAIFVPVGLVLLAFGHDRGFTLARLCTHTALGFAPLLVAAFFSAGSSERALQLLTSGLIDPLYSDWSGLPQAAVLTTSLAGAVMGARMVSTLRAPEAALLWLLLTTSCALIVSASATARGIWVLTGALVIIIALVETAYSMAFDDELTGLPGRRALGYALGSLRAPYTIALVDIDHFKSFNDRYGHAVGDQVLRMVASHLKNVHGGGTAYRSGGEEFTIVFPGLQKAEAVEHVEEIRETVAKARFALRKRPGPRGKKAKGARNRGTSAATELQVTISAGVAAVAARHDTAEAVLRAADKAMYRAKREGRNRVLAVVATVLMASCGGDVPSGADVQDIMAEAAGSKPTPRWGDSPARRAVRSSFRSVLYFDSVHEAEVGRRFRGPYLSSYFMLPDSYVGGDFPGTTAGLLREVQQYNREYLQQMESYPSVLNDRLASVDLPEDERRALAEEITQSLATQRRPILDAVSAFDAFVVAAANLYEFVAANSRSIKSMREGLVISDTRVLQRFNSLANDVDRAHAAADTVMRRLVPEQQTRFSRMGLTKRID